MSEASIQSSLTGRSGGWRTIAGEESDDEDSPTSASAAQSPESEGVPSPRLSAEPVRRGEMQPTERDAKAVKETARAAVINTKAQAGKPKGAPSINVVSPTPTTPQRPLAHRSASMPGSFNGEDDLIDDDEHGETQTAGSSPKPEPADDLWGMAARMKKLVLG